MRNRIETAIPGRAAIELVSFYEEFRSYYPQCEMETKRWFVENVRPDWWICDVGANVGYYSILFSQLAPEGRVFAFEPTTTASMLKENLQHNNGKNVEVHEVALGAVTGAHQDRIYRLWGTEGEIQVYPFYKLDDFMEEKRISRLDCIKIDVDSFDFEVLLGAEKTLQDKNPVIVVELNHALAKRNQSAGEALAWLADQGYRRALVLDHDNFVLHRGEDSRIDVPGSKKLELAFPPPMRFDESIDYVEGRELPTPFLTIGRLQNGARFTSVSSASDRRPIGVKTIASAPSSAAAKISHSIRRLFARHSGEQQQEQETQGGEFDLASIIGSEIETSAQMWGYALTLEFDPMAFKSLSAHSVLSVEVAAEVGGGRLGIAIGSDDPSKFSSIERTMVAMPDVQRMIVTAPVSSLRHLILRNVAVEGTKTKFSLMGIKAKVLKSS